MKEYKLLIGAAVLGTLGLVYVLKKQSKPISHYEKARLEAHRYKLKHKSNSIDWSVVGTPKHLNRLGYGETSKGVIYGLNGHKMFAPYGLNGKPDFSKMRRLA